MPFYDVCALQFPRFTPAAHLHVTRLWDVEVKSFFWKQTYHKLQMFNFVWQGAYAMMKEMLAPNFLHYDTCFGQAKGQIASVKRFWRGRKRGHFGKLCCAANQNQCTSGATNSDKLFPLCNGWNSLPHSCQDLQPWVVRTFRPWVQAQAIHTQQS